MSRMYINKYTYENPIKLNIKLIILKYKNPREKMKNSTIGFLK